MTSRVRRVLKLVDELELAPAELRELRAELGEREECVVDLEGASAEERAALLTIKKRIDSILRDEAPTLSMAEGNALVREELRTRRQLAGATPAPVQGTSRSTRRAG